MGAYRGEGLRAYGVKGLGLGFRVYRALGFRV